MTDVLTILGLGFFLGMRHATDPDHVIAVSTLVARYRSTRSAALLGIVWGVGHTLTIFVVGGGIILFSWVIPWRVGLSMEFAVGIMLIVLGLANLGGVLEAINRTVRRGRRSPNQIHSHHHSHGDYVHAHPHGHAPETHPHEPDQTPVGWLDRHCGGIGLYQLVRPLVVGIVHGLAGSAAIALLVLTTIGDPRWSVFYLLIFGGGTIVGMLLITAAVSAPFRLDREPSGPLAARLRLASGLVSVGFGCLLAYQVGFVQGLLTGAAR